MRRAWRGSREPVLRVQQGPFQTLTAPSPHHRVPTGQAGHSRPAGHLRDESLYPRGRLRSSKGHHSSVWLLLMDGLRYSGGTVSSSEIFECYPRNGLFISCSA